MKSQTKLRILVLIIAQFFCTSLWFAPNSIINSLVVVYNLNSNSLGHLTSAVQFGFISGTLVFAIFSLADRFSPSKLFFISAILGALLNLSMLYEKNNFISLLILRYLTGVSLAGIYPIGMKIAADYLKKDLGKYLGFLVGALVLGTSFPHFIKSSSHELFWESVITTTSFLSFLGGISVYLFLPDGPLRMRNNKPNFGIISSIFKNKKFRIAAFGYFGHMWELYTFWTFVPILISMYFTKNAIEEINIHTLSFSIIAIGSLACIVAGYLSEHFKTKTIARNFLTLSALCCLSLPFFYNSTPTIFITFLAFWGFVVIGDSPLFSTLVAHSASAETKGTALTIVNSIGFTITILSIQLITKFHEYSNSVYIFTILAIGPIFGLIGLFNNKKSD